MPGFAVILRAVAFNTLIAIALMAVAILGGMPPSARAAWRSFRMSFVLSQTIGTLCTVTLPWVLRRLSGRRWKWLWIVLTLALVNGVGVALATAILRPLEGWDASFGTVFWSIYRFALIVTLVVGITAILVESLRHHVVAAQMALKTAEVERARAQLASLESRVQPHFLFNALNSISALIRQDAVRAERMVEQLSRLLRASLDTHQASLVPLEQELQIVRDYLEIQAARFEGRMRWEVDDAGPLAGAPVPPFSVQSLVENSVKFAVAPRREGGRIAITVRPEGERFTVAVTDDGPGFAAEAKVPGHGLDNLKMRLTALYGEAGSLRVCPAEPGVTVSITMPVRVHASLPG